MNTNYIKKKNTFENTQYITKNVKFEKKGKKGCTQTVVYV